MRKKKIILEGKHHGDDKLYIDVFRKKVKIDVLIDNEGNCFEMEKDELISLLLK